MFTSPNLAKNITETATSFKSYLKGNVDKSFFITTVTEDKVEKELVKLNPHKSSGFDELHSAFNKH